MSNLGYPYNQPWHPAYQRRYGSKQADMAPYGTGPLQDFRMPWELGSNPSSESLSRAAINEYTQRVRDLANKGAASRMENSLAGARGAVQQALVRSGMSPYSLGAIQMSVGAQNDTMVGQQKNEAELDREYEFAKVQGMGNVAEMENARAGRLFNNWSMIQQINLARQQYEDQKKAQQSTSLGNPYNPYNPGAY